MPNPLDLRVIARALGGEVQGRQVLAPGPNHSRKDRSLSVRPSHQSPSGYVVFSHAGDDFAQCKDYVAARLGMPADSWRKSVVYDVHGCLPEKVRANCADNVHEVAITPDNTARIARAIAIWNGAVDARETVAERYLAFRGLKLDPLDNVREVLRFHRQCPWRDEVASGTIYVPAMVAALRSIQTDEITGIHRTRLTPEGVKVDRRMLGQASGAAIKIDTDDSVTTGLHIAEGIETALAGRQFGFQPVWALGSAGAIASFPVLGGIESLTLLAEQDDANRRAVDACASRWHAAGREVIVVEPRHGSDLNDVIVRGAA